MSQNAQGGAIMEKDLGSSGGLLSHGADKRAKGRGR